MKKLRNIGYKKHKRLSIHKLISHYLSLLKTIYKKGLSLTWAKPNYWGLVRLIASMNFDYLKLDQNPRLLGFKVNLSGQAKLYIYIYMILELKISLLRFLKYFNVFLNKKNIFKNIFLKIINTWK